MDNNASPQTIGHYIDLIIYKSYADLKAEAARTYINYLWWILDPLMSLTVYYLVMGVLFQRGGENFIFTLLVGVVFWRWYAESISHGSSTIMNGQGLMSQVDMPKWIFPIVCIVTDGTKFLFTLGIMLMILLALGPGFKATWLLLPVIIFSQLLLITGVALTISSIVPFIPDLRHVISTLIMMQMFVSGIFYDSTQIAPKYLFWFFLNPIARLVHEYREILLNGLLPNWDGIFYVSTLGVLFILIGLSLIKRNNKTYPRLN